MARARLHRLIGPIPPVKVAGINEALMVGTGREWVEIADDRYDGR
jgi:hypothetical protein